MAPQACGAGSTAKACPRVTRRCENRPLQKPLLVATVPGMYNFAGHVGLPEG